MSEIKEERNNLTVKDEVLEATSGAEEVAEQSFFKRYLAWRRKKKEERRRKEEEKSPAQDILELIAYVAAAFCIALFIKRFVGQPVIIEGDSMNDTLENHQVVWTNKLGYDPERFDVVVVESDATDEKMFIKRVIALPGETVYVDDENKIWITPADGGETYELNDPYGYFSDMARSRKILNGIANNPDGSYTCGEDEYFVMGDNRYNSNDSRALGAFKKNEIVEHAVFRLWPLTKFGNFDKDNK